MSKYPFCLHASWLAWVILVLVFALGGCDSNGNNNLNAPPGKFEPVDVSAAYEYDELGRLILVRYTNGATIRYSYDAAGNITTREEIPN